MSDDKDVLLALRTWMTSFSHRSMREFVHYAMNQSFSISQIGALFHIAKEGTCGVSEIGEDLGMTSAAASQMIDRLVKNGLIFRAENPHDRRAKRIELTPEGETIIKGAAAARANWFEKLVDEMTAEEKDTVVRGLNILTEKAKLLESRT